MRIERNFVPETYRAIGPEELFHDIALLRLVDQQHWFHRVQWGPMDAGAPMTYIGLGRQADSKMTQLQHHFLDWLRGDYKIIEEYPFYLQQAQTSLLTGSDCDTARTTTDTNELDDSRFCIDVTNAAPDYGDSGGPVVEFDTVTGGARLVGLLQGVKGTVEHMQRYPRLGLVTDVEVYRNWIEWTLHESYQQP